MVFLILLKIARDLTPLTNRYRISPLHRVSQKSCLWSGCFNTLIPMKSGTLPLWWRELLCKAAQTPPHLTWFRHSQQRVLQTWPVWLRKSHNFPSSQCISYLQLLISVAWEVLFWPKRSLSTLDGGPKQKSIKAKVSQIIVFVVLP